MASASDITEVRSNTGFSDNEDPWTDEVLGALIDGGSVAGATAHIWAQKVVEASELVDVTEAGASHKFSDIFKNAAAMRDYWEKRRQEEVNPPVLAGRIVVRKIVRT